MGKKVKVGKARKDKFYQLAKESGYRSRAAFKLLQLNRTYHFLEKSRVCIDLCAAPGGWLQVAATNMPMSSIIIGVDLAPIKPIGNVITHVEDITTAKCLQLLKKDLNEMKADVVLHDGAPNVGKNWIHDAYQQNILVLQSFKLATEFLKKGGYFVTKVFRSKDYYSLLWVLQQFFKKVDATKPQASRNESAEIFVVCQNYKAPDKIDPKFFDLKFVFSDVDNDNNMMRTANDLFKDDMTKRHRGGYPDNDYTLYHRLNASEFVQKDNFLELLANTNEIVLDDKAIENHEATTTEIKECLKDIRLLGKNDIKTLLKWRLKLRSLYKVRKSEVDKLKSDENRKEATNGHENGKKEAGEGEEEEEDIDAEIKDALDSEKKWEKKKKKKLLKEKQKFNKKVNAKLELKDDQIDFHLQGDNELFNLNKIKTNKQLIELQKTLPDLELIGANDFDDEDDMLGLNKKKKKSFSKDDNDQSYLESSVPVKKSAKKPASDDEDEEDEEMEFSGDDDENLNEDLLNGDDDDDEEENPLLDDLTNGEAKKSVASQWYNKESFDFLDSKEEENEELMRELERLEESGQTVPKTKKVKKSEQNMDRFDGKEDEDEAKRALEAENDTDSDSDTDSEEETTERVGKKRKKGRKSQQPAVSEAGKKLSPVELALGEMVTNSKKTKRDLIDDSFNRYSGFGKEEDLPEWFVEDEEKNFRKPVQVPKQILADYRSKDDKINARAIKKVVEAQARKKRRMSKKLDRARKKAEAISENMDMTNNERVKEMKAVYKRAGLLSKKKSEVRYVVGKRGMSTKGLAKSGPYRLVDGKMKKDRRNALKRSKRPGSAKKKQFANKKTSNRKTARKQR